MELRKEFQDIYDKNLRALNGKNYLNRSEALYEAVKDCQELADRPPRELTDAEITAIFRAEFGLGGPIPAVDAAPACERKE